MSFFDFFRRPPVRRHGWLPDPVDNRDKHVGALELESIIPAACSLRHPAITPRDQDGTSSCVAFTWAQALEIAYAHRGVLTGDLSAIAIYFWTLAADGNPGQDVGTYLRTGAKVVSRFGAPSEKVWPFRASRVSQSPPWQAYRDAYDRRGLRGYYRVSASDTASIRMAIASGKPVVGGWLVDLAFTRHSGTSIVKMITGETIGGHAMCVLGYDEQGCFEIINSWGTGWGDRGYCKVTETFIAQGHDLWVIDVQP